MAGMAGGAGVSGGPGGACRDDLHPGVASATSTLVDRLSASDLLHLATHDTLTGLPNRLLLLEVVDAAVARSRPFAVLCLDIDGFHTINQTLGRRAGDELLCIVAERLRSICGAGGTAARMSGDEFVVVTDGTPTRAMELARAVEAALRQPFSLGAATVTVSASIGLAEGPGEDLIHDASAALAVAKRKGRITAFEPSMHRRLRDDLSLGLQLRGAPERGELELVFQPIVRANGTPYGVEALLRWDHPTHGLLSPAAFLETAEDTGVMAEIGAWILNRACVRAANLLHPTGSGRDRRDLIVSVNLSPRQLTRTDIVEEVRRALDASGLDPGRLLLEITESALVEDPRGAAAVVADLRSTGVRVALDDFGTGYSSLSVLHHVAVDVVKIDRSFVAALGRDPRAGALIDGLVGLSHGLDAVAVAEGVETARQHALLARSGCDLFQGYLWSPPVGGEDLALALAS